MRVQNEHVPELSHVRRAGSRERDQETNRLKGRKGKKTDIAQSGLYRNSLGTGGLVPGL